MAGLEDRRLTVFHFGIMSLSSPRWVLRPHPRLVRLLRKLASRRPAESAALLRNLDRYLNLLDQAPHVRLIQAGFLHPEPHGVVAVDERGGGPGLRALRLYTLADERTRILHLLHLGDKSSQSRDLRLLPHLIRTRDLT